MNIPNPYKGREAVMFDFAVTARENDEWFVYVLIPGDIGPHERGERFEDPMHETLASSGLGRVTGGGSQLGEGKSIEFCGLDVVLSEREAGIRLLKERLRELGTPPGTIIEEYLPERRDHEVTPQRIQKEK